MLCQSSEAQLRKTIKALLGPFLPDQPRIVATREVLKIVIEHPHFPILKSYLHETQSARQRRIPSLHNHTDAPLQELLVINTIAYL